MELLADSGCQELSLVVFDADPDNGDTLVGELCLGVDCIHETLKVRNMREEWPDMEYCSKGQIKISAKMVTTREKEGTCVEDEEHLLKPNSMKHEEAVRTLEVAEEKKPNNV